jgi:hypothetical protein
MTQIFVVLLFYQLLLVMLVDAPLSSLMDSTTSPKLTIAEGEGVGVRSLTYSTFRVEGHAGALG